MPKADPFDKNVESYESWFERNRPTYESEIEAIRELLQTSGRGLEIGVGTGRFAAPLGLGFGIDPSRNMLRAAIKRGIEGIAGVAEDLPFKDSCFDIILLVTTVCFLDDVHAALKQAYRVTRDNGKILVGFIDRESPLGRIYETHKNDNVFYRNASFLSANEVLSCLRQAGFRDFIFRQTVFGTPPEMKQSELAKPGFGKGSFVVVRGKKASLQ